MSTSNRSQITADFVKTVVRSASKNKGKEKINKNQNLFTPIILIFQVRTYDIFFLEIASVAAKHASILSTHFLNGDFKLLNASKDCVSFWDHLGICYEISDMQYTFQRQKQSEYRKHLSIERLFLLSIFLISLEILWCNIVSLKHPFSCLCDDTLEACIIPMCSLALYFFLITNEADTFSLKPGTHLSTQQAKAY